MNCSKDPSPLGTGKVPENLGRGGNLYNGCCETGLTTSVSDPCGIAVSMGIGPTVD